MFSSVLNRALAGSVLNPPEEIEKGDYSGHPFRGNQYVRVSGRLAAPRSGHGKAISVQEWINRSEGTTEDTADTLTSLLIAEGTTSIADAEQARDKALNYDYSWSPGSDGSIYTSYSEQRMRANLKYAVTERIGERMAEDPEFQKWLEGDSWVPANDTLGVEPVLAELLTDERGWVRPPQEAAQIIARTYVKGWAAEVADSDHRALALQLAAQHEFGGSPESGKAMLKRSGAGYRDQEARLRMQTQLAGEIRQILDDWEPAMRAFHRAVYAETQDFLAANGIKEVTLFRGTGVPVGQRVLGEFSANTNPLSSWTLHRGTAAEFSADFDGLKSALSQVGAVVGSTVPAAQVYSTPFTGPGCLNEAEFVLLNMTGSTVRLS